MILFPVSDVKTTVLDASAVTLAASPEVIARQRTGRHSIGITAGESVIYLGGKNVTAENGMAIPAGTTITMPVSNTSMESLYVVGGNCVLTEFF